MQILPRGQARAANEASNENGISVVNSGKGKGGWVGISTLSDSGLGLHNMQRTVPLCYVRKHPKTSYAAMIRHFAEKPNLSY